MSELRGLLPKDASGASVLRAEGVCIPVQAKVGSSAGAYRDILDLSQYVRAFIGLSIFNPDTTNWLWIAVGGVGCGDSQKSVIVPPNMMMTLDSQTFGETFKDAILSGKALRIRGKLVNTSDTAATSGTTATGTIGYAAIQPTDGMTVTVNGRVYEFSNDLSVKPGRYKVDIGATADLSWTAFKNAVNANDSEVTLSINTGTDIVTLTSNLGGTDGNAQTFADGGDGGTVTGATFSGSGNLSGGVAGLRVLVHVW